LIVRTRTRKKNKSNQKNDFFPLFFFSDSDIDQYMEDTGKKECKLIGHSGPVYSTSFSPDNRYLISGSEDNSGFFFLALTFF